MANGKFGELRAAFINEDNIMKNQFNTKYFLAAKDGYYMEVLVSLAFEFCIFGAYFLLIHLGLVPDVAPEDALKAKMLFYVPLIIFYAIEIPFEYLTVIKLIIDTRTKNTITETVYVKNHKHEFSITGRNFTSRIGNFFPKDMGVGKFKLFFNSEDGTTFYVRTIMSHKKSCIFDDWSENGKSQIPLRITYLRHSKVLVCVEPVKQYDYDKKTVLKILNLNNSI